MTTQSFYGKQDCDYGRLYETPIIMCYESGNYKRDYQKHWLLMNRTSPKRPVETSFRVLPFLL